MSEDAIFGVVGMYKKVYSPGGEPFEVRVDRANDLILQKGWTQSPPIIVEVVSDPKPKSRPRRKLFSSDEPATVATNRAGGKLGTTEIPGVRDVDGNETGFSKPAEVDIS